MQIIDEGDASPGAVLAREGEGERELCLRRPRADDRALLIAGRDDEFRRFLGPGSDDPRPTACIEVGGRLAGWIDFDRDQAWLADDEVNVGYALFPWARGQGHATRALLALLGHIARATPYRRASLLIDRDNLGSLGVAARAGFLERPLLPAQPPRQRAFVRAVAPDPSAFARAVARDQ